MRATLLLPSLAAGMLILGRCDFEDFGGLERYHEDFHYSHPLKAGGRLTVEGFNFQRPLWMMMIDACT